MADCTELWAHSLRGTAFRVWTFIMPTSRPSLRTRWQRRPVRRTSAPYSSSVMCPSTVGTRSEEHTSELQSLAYLVCRLLLEKKKKMIIYKHMTLQQQVVSVSDCLTEL